jgi:hypothetical protein
VILTHQVLDQKKVCIGCLTLQTSWDPSLEPIRAPAEVHLRFLRTADGFRFVVAVETDTESRLFLYSGEISNGEPEFALDRINYNSKASQLSSLQISKNQVWSLWRDTDAAAVRPLLLFPFSISLLDTPAFCGSLAWPQ